MLMMIWIGLILLICAGFSAYAGASQLEQAKQRAKCSLDACIGKQIERMLNIFHRTV